MCDFSELSSISQLESRMGAAPSQINSGTALYIAAVLLVIIWAWALSRGGQISKDTFQIVSILATCAGLATWLLWLCAWMHQWHPLITPEWRAG